MLWKLLFTYPLMVGIQIVSARIGRITGHGLATNIRHYPPSLLYFIVGLGIATDDVGRLLGNYVGSGSGRWLWPSSAGVVWTIGGTPRLYL